MIFTGRSKSASGQLQQKFPHVSGTDHEVYAHYYRNGDVARQAIEGLTGQDVSDNSFLTELSIRAIRLYQANGDLLKSSLNSKKMGDNIDKCSLLGKRRYFPPLNYVTVSQLIPIAKKYIHVVREDVLSIAELYVKAKGVLNRPCRDGEYSSAFDLGEARQQRLEDILTDPSIDSTKYWVEQDRDLHPSDFHLTIALLGWSPCPQKFEAWVDGKDLKSKLSGSWVVDKSI